MIRKKFQFNMILSILAVLFLITFFSVWVGFIEGITDSSGNLIKLTFSLKIIFSIVLVILFYVIYWFYSSKKKSDTNLDTKIIETKKY